MLFVASWCILCLWFSFNHPLLHFRIHFSCACEKQPLKRINFSRINCVTFASLTDTTDYSSIKHKCGLYSVRCRISQKIDFKRLGNLPYTYKTYDISRIREKCDLFSNASVKIYYLSFGLLFAASYRSFSLISWAYMARVQRRECKWILCNREIKM